MRGNLANITKYPITCVILAITVLLVIGTLASKTMRHILSNSKEE